MIWLSDGLGGGAGLIEQLLGKLVFHDRGHQRAKCGAIDMLFQPRLSRPIKKAIRWPHQGGRFTVMLDARGKVIRVDPD